MSKSTEAPSWATNLTCDIPQLDCPNLSRILKQYSGQALSLVWTRLPIKVRTAILKWWENV